MDADRQSIRSTRSNRGAVAGAGSRFSSIFGIKPRGAKTPGGGRAGNSARVGEEGVALGKAQSHSMPRPDHLQGLPGSLMSDSGARKRNSSISGVFGGDLGGMTDGAGEGGGMGESSAAVTSPAQVGNRRRAFGMGSIFGRDKEGFNLGGGWPTSFTAFGRRPGSPRPGSTHSNELPRPSMDSSRWGVETWPSQGGGEGAAGARSSPLSFTGGWPLPSNAREGGSRLWGSRHPSRRPSVQYGASGSGPVEDIMEDEDSDVLDASPVAKTRLAPIGTKPSGRNVGREEVEESGDVSPSAPRLNPAAKDFKSFFGIKSKDKGRAGSPSTAAAGAPSSSLASTPRLEYDGHTYHDDSPPDSRKSRSDARSMTTTESSLAGDAGESLNELARTPSYTPSHTTASDATGPSPMLGANKESFMQKISRKSSSGKFSLPTFKREKSRLDTSGYGAATQHEGDEGDGGEMALTASVGSLAAREGRESKEVVRGGGSGRGWSQVLKLAG
ncbi:hypothetical protein LTR53_018006, partial [Teratosphaeriaceae sp. CCFEE 6253]